MQNVMGCVRCYGVYTIVCGMCIWILLVLSQNSANNGYRKWRYQQAFEEDCYILKMTAGFDRALSHNPHKDGFLTRDYIYLPSTVFTMFRVKDLQICCFEDSIRYMNNHRVHSLKLRLAASNGVTTLNDTTEEAGAALMKLLTERNSVIHTNGGNVLKMDAYEKYAKTVL